MLRVRMLREELALRGRVTRRDTVAIHCTMIGRLGADAELAQAGSTSVLKMRLATTRKSKDGETTTWVGCSIFGKRAESLAKLGLAKGDRIAVRGELFSREYNSKTYIELVADDVELLGGKKGESTGVAPSNGAGRGATGKADNYGLDADDSDVPF